MKLIIILLSVVIVLFIIYNIYLRCQINNITKQLDTRLSENTRQVINISLVNFSINKLVSNINRALKAEENLRLKTVKEENEFKELIANISHDLRTPLTSIKGYIQLIEKCELNKEQRRMLDVAKNHSDELGNLIEHFFEYSYFLNAEPEINVERINITNLITECLIASVISFEEKNITVKFEEAKQIYINSDKELITRIIQNLIRNSIQHSRGSEVEVKLEKTDENIKVSFSNMVDKENNIDINRIFDRFYTGDSARKHSTGLGLSIVKLLSEKMGGKVDAELNNNRISINVIIPINIFC